MSAVATLAGESRTITFSVDEKNLLKNSRRFFGSVPDAFAELVQNAFRAGARHLTVTADSASRTITFADNGRGCADPAKLIEFAGSGWDSSVVEPAGIGFFGLLGIAESVSVRSVHGHPVEAWSLAITADVLDGGLVDFPLTVEPLPVERDDHRGLTLTAVLRADQQWPSFDEKALGWRHFFPLELTLTVDGVTRELPVPAFGAVRTLATPVGTLHIVPADQAKLSLPGMKSRDALLLPVWEHRATAHALRNDALFGATRKFSRLESAVINALEAQHGGPEHVAFVWEIDPTCGVRPQLPDRHAMIADVALTNALGVLRDFLLGAVDYDHLTTLFARVANDEVLVERRAYGERLRQNAQAQAYALFGCVALGKLNPDAFLAAAGYQVVRGIVAPADAEFSVEDDSDGWQSESSSLGQEMFVRAAHRFPHPGQFVQDGMAVADVVGPDHAPTLQLACDEARHIPRLSLLLTRGLRLETMDGALVKPLDHFWAGAREAFDAADVGLPPTLFPAEGRPEAVALYGILNVESFETVLTALREDFAFAHLAASVLMDEPTGCFSGIGEYVECEWRDYSIDWDQLRADALEEVCQALGGEMAAKAAMMAAVASLREVLCSHHIEERQMRNLATLSLPDGALDAVRRLRATQAEAAAAFEKLSEAAVAA